MTVSAERLAALTEGRKSFCKDTPGLQLYWDATSLGLFKQCPRRYYYEIIEGHQRRHDPHLRFGILYHECLELYDRLSYKEALPHDEAVRSAARLALEKAGDRDAEGTFHSWDRSGHPNKTRDTLVRSVVWYLDTFGRADPASTMSLGDAPAVEVSFSFGIDLFAPSGMSYVLCGHLDRAVDFAGQRYIMDRKTTKSTLSSDYFDQYCPDNQMSLYSLADFIIFKEPGAGIMIDAAQVAVNFTRYLRGFSPRSKDQLTEWLEDACFWIKQAEVCAQRRHWPQNDASCHHYGGCPFRKICNKTTAVRDRFLAADFEVRTPRWDPAVPRS